MLQITAALANVYIISDKSLVDKIFVNNTFCVVLNIIDA